MAKRAPHARQDEPADRPGHRSAAAHPWLLYAVVFVCGAVLMALEIVGSRMLAPYFGNSIFVWGSLISVVLAALSLGYWLGGIAADRWPRLSVLATLIAVPGRHHRAPAVRLSRTESRHRGRQHGRAARAAGLQPHPVPGPQRVPGHGLALRRAAAGAGGGLGGFDGGRPVRGVHGGKHRGDADHGILSHRGPRGGEHRPRSGPDSCSWWRRGSCWAAGA